MASVQGGYLTLMMACRSLFSLIDRFTVTIGAWLTMNIHVFVRLDFRMDLSLSLAAVACLAYEPSSLTSS